MKYFILIFFTALAIAANSQSIEGTIVDSEKTPIEYASVRLMNISDSTVVTGAFTDVSGFFLIENILGDAYFIRITYANLETRDIKVDLSVEKNLQLETIQMKLDKTINLDEVTASGSMDVLKAGIDKKVYSVAEDLTSKGGNVSDILNNIPSISVDQDGKVSLRGDGNVTILIDGRPSTLTSSEGQSLLDALPANSIERIEVVTNPSARYDPDGTSGIINIVLKKNKLKGFNGMVSGTVATGDFYQANGSLSYRNKFINTSLSYSLDYHEGYRNFYSDLDRSFENDSSSRLAQSRIGKDLNSSHTLVFGTDFFLNERNVIGVSATGNFGRRERSGDLENSQYDQFGELNSRWDRISFDPEKSSNFDANINYVRTFKKEKGEWSINANQSFRKENEKGFYDQYYLNLDESPTGLAELNQRLNNNSTNRITTAQTDASFILAKIKARAEVGGKVILRNDDISTYSEARDTITDEFRADTLANFNYRYSEAIYSIYGVFGQELGKFKYQVGIRGEYAEQTPELISSNLNYKNTYGNVFPSAHVKYDLDKVSQFSLSYSKRINRADSRQLNPFTSYADPFNLRSGNPELKPEYIHSFDLGYSFTKKKLIFSLSVYHRITNDVINRIKLYNDNNTAVVTYKNIDKSESTGFEAVVIYKPFKWMKNTISANGNYINYTNSDPTTNWNNSGFNWGAKYVLAIDFWKNSATFQLNGNYEASRVTPQGLMKPRTSMDIALDKRFLKKKSLSIGVRLSDVFNSKNFSMELEQTGVRQNVEYKWLTRRLYFSVSYRFGNLDGKAKALKEAREGGGGGDAE
jgi:outer membrane receptor protein involved in Fe transport